MGAADFQSSPRKIIAQAMNTTEILYLLPSVVGIVLLTWHCLLLSSQVTLQNRCLAAEELGKESWVTLACVMFWSYWGGNKSCVPVPVLWLKYRCGDSYHWTSPEFPLAANEVVNLLDFNWWSQVFLKSFLPAAPEVRVTQPSHQRLIPEYSAP